MTYYYNINVTKVKSILLLSVHSLELYFIATLVLVYQKFFVFFLCLLHIGKLKIKNMKNVVLFVNQTALQI